jgi:hypothetical protein
VAALPFLQDKKDAEIQRLYLEIDKACKNHHADGYRAGVEDAAQLVDKKSKGAWDFSDLAAAIRALAEKVKP